ncbi:MAG: GNAT family N-acetyltransferase [Rubricoccaceae bacterium]
MIRRLTPSDAAIHRAFMLDAYARHPEAFTSTVAERESLPLDWWIRRVSDASDAPQRVLGAFQGRQLVGGAGLRRETRPKTQHKATLFGMAVHPLAQGHGIGRALVEAVLEHARAEAGIEIVQLTVTETNQRARDLYAACGFEAFGTEPYAIRVGGRYVRKVHMWCPTRAVSVASSTSS